MEREFLSGHLVMRIMVSGKMISSMAKVPMSFLMVESMMASGRKI